MDAKANATRGATVHLAVVAVMVSGAVAYLMHHLPTQRQALIERNFRALAAVSGVIEGAVTNLCGSMQQVVNVGDRCLEVTQWETNQSPLLRALHEREPVFNRVTNLTAVSNVEAVKDASSVTNWTIVTNRTEVSGNPPVTNIASVTSITTVTNRASVTSIETVTNTTTVQVGNVEVGRIRVLVGNAEPGATQKPCATLPLPFEAVERRVKEWLEQVVDVRRLEVGLVRPDREARRVRVEWDQQSAAPELRLTCQGKDTNIVGRGDIKRGCVEARAWVRVNAMLDRLLDEKVFDALIVADRSGRVLGGRGVFSVPPALVTMACEQRMQTNVSEPGGIGFRVFGMPLNILGRADADASISTSDWRWAIIGVQREAAFAAEARQLPEWVVVWFVLLLSITLFSWPLLNVLSLHQREAVRMRTVLLLHASVIALLGTLTLWTCRHFGEQRLEQARGDRLKGVALGIQAHIERELAKIGTQLQGLDKRLHHDATNQSLHVANRTRILESLLDPSTNAYPELIRVGWLHKRTGMQLLKWTVNSNDTPLISVANRDYFKVIARGDGFPPRSIPGLPGSQPFFLESIYSSNTGEHLATFSRLSDNDPQLISTLDCKLVSVSKAVLPHRMGFCILDRSGRALFHSDGRRVQRENFVDECERDDDLRAALGAGQSKVIRVRYCGEYHSVSLHPWQATGWTVVTFEPVWKVEMALWHACYLAAWACTGCTVALASLGLGLFFATARTGGRDGRLSAAVRSLEWLRPHAGQARACWQLGTLNVALGAMAWGVSQPLAELGWDWIPILCCPLAGLLAWGTWHLARTRKQTNAKDGFPQGGLPPASPADVRATAACNTTLLLLISALPVWLVFDSVLEEDLRRSARHQQAELARGIEARQADISDGLARRGLASEPDPGPKGQGEGSLAKFYKHRTRRHWDFYLKPVFDGAEPFSVIHALRVRDDPRGPGFQPGHWLDWVPCPRGDDEADMVGFSRDMKGSFWQWQPDDPEAVGRIQPPMVATAARVPWLKELAAGTNSAGVREAGALIVPAVAPVGDDPPWVYVVLAGIGLAGVAACIHHHAGRRLWCFGIRPVSAAQGGELATARVGSFGRDLLLGTSRESLGKRAFQMASKLAAGGPIVELDLRQEEVAQAIMQGRLLDLMKQPFKVLVLLNLDAGPGPGEDGSSAWTQHRRKMLEWARQISSGHVVVTTTRNPLNFTMGDSEEHRAREDQGWRQLLKEWRIQVAHASAGEWEGRTAAARVRGLWDMCSPDERWVLQCLALGRAVPCHNEALGRVLEPERGIMVLSGRLRFVDREMWDLARRSEVGLATAGSLEDDSPALWERLRGPLALLLGLGAVFLFVTQREAFNLAVAALTGVGAALLPLISKLEAIWKPRDRSLSAKT